MINAARSASSKTINARRTARCTGSTIANRQLKIENEKWARQDSNLGPRDYESPALTAELQAQHKEQKHVMIKRKIGNDFYCQILPACDRFLAMKKPVLKIKPYRGSDNKYKFYLNLRGFGGGRMF